MGVEHYVIGVEVESAADIAHGPSTIVQFVFGCAFALMLPQKQFADFRSALHLLRFLILQQRDIRRLRNLNFLP